MKMFEEPRIEVNVFEVEDVIATSGEGIGGDGSVGGGGNTDWS